MNQKQAAETIYKMIEQANAAGMFKRLVDLDTARQALAVLSKPKENSNNDGTSKTVEPT